MSWEYIGKQELPQVEGKSRRHTYEVAVWRTPVPGGWLLLALNARASDPQPAISFYPEAEHTWVATDPPEAQLLLRAVAAHAITSDTGAGKT